MLKGGVAGHPEELPKYRNKPTNIIYLYLKGLAELIGLANLWGSLDTLRRLCEKRIKLSEK